MRECKNCKFTFDGRRCPECHRREAAAYRLLNGEKVKAQKIAHRLANQEKISASRKAYREANPEKVRLQKAAHAAKHSAKTVARVQAWRKANPDGKRIQNHNYRARKEGRGTLSRGLADRLFIAQNGLCTCCGLSLADGYNLDHIIPLAKGGLNVDSNMQLLRPLCNGRKHAKMPDDYAMQYGAAYGLV